MLLAAAVNVNLVVAIPVAIGLIGIVTAVVKLTLVFSKLQSSIDALTRVIETLSTGHTDHETRIKSLETAEVIRSAKEAAQSATQGSTP